MPKKRTALRLSVSGLRASDFSKSNRYTIFHYKCVVLQPVWSRAFIFVSLTLRCFLLLLSLFPPLGATWYMK